MICLLKRVVEMDGVNRVVNLRHTILIMDALAPEEIDDEVEVAFDEEYDPKREEQLKNQLANQKGSLSPYWAHKSIS